MSSKINCPNCGGAKSTERKGDVWRQMKSSDFLPMAARECGDCGHVWEPPVPKWALVLILLLGILGVGVTGVAFAIGVKHVFRQILLSIMSILFIVTCIARLRNREPKTITPGRKLGGFAAVTEISTDLTPNVVAVLPPPVAPPRPRVWTVFITYVVTQVLDLIVAGVVSVLIAGKMRSWSFTSTEEFSSAVTAAGATVTGALGTILCTMVIFAGAAILGALLSPHPWRKRLRLEPVKLTRLGWIAGIGGIFAIGLVLKSLDGLSLVPKSPVWEDLAAFIRGLSGMKLLATVFVVGVAPGIAEELLFRGYIQTRLCARWGVSWGIFWTALMFGVMHLDLVQGVFAVIVGVYLGYITEKTGSVLPAVILHAANNTVATLMVDHLSVDIVGRWPNVVTLVAGFAVVWVCVRYLGSNLSTTTAPPVVAR